MLPTSGLDLHTSDALAVLPFSICALTRGEAYNVAARLDTDETEYRDCILGRAGSLAPVHHSSRLSPRQATLTAHSSSRQAPRPCSHLVCYQTSDMHTDEKTHREERE